MDAVREAPSLLSESMSGMRPNSLSEISAAICTERNHGLDVTSIAVISKADCVSKSTAYPSTMSPACEGLTPLTKPIPDMMSKCPDAGISKVPCVSKQTRKPIDYGNSM
jgi:hypothetical protein